MQNEGNPRNIVSAPTEPIIHCHTQILKLIFGDKELETAEEEGIQLKEKERSQKKEGFTKESRNTSPPQSDGLRINQRKPWKKTTKLE